MTILNINKSLAGLGAGLLAMAGVLSPPGARAQSIMEWPILVGSLPLILTQERSPTNAGPGWNADWAELSAGAPGPGPAETVASLASEPVSPAGAALAAGHDPLAPVSIPEPSAAALALAGLATGGLFGALRCLRGPK